MTAVDRRRFLQIMGASMALAGLGSAGCIRTPPEDNEPYVLSPAPSSDAATCYATALRIGGVARGVLARCKMGRPLKIEGNPDHPASLGATDARAQADLLTLYDPERSQRVLRASQPSTWSAFLKALPGALAGPVRILTGRITSATLIGQLQAFIATHPDARWDVWEPIPIDPAAHRFDQADIIVALDHDILADAVAGVRYARDLMQRRQPGTAMSRLYVAESGMSITGAMADLRLGAPSRTIGTIAADLARALRIVSGPVGSTFAVAAARDLEAHAGRSLVVAGPTQPRDVHALVAFINAHLGNPVAPAPEPSIGLHELLDDIEAGRVQTLVIVDSNPAYTAPALPLARIPKIIHMGLYADETAAASTWHLPMQHDLETWSDARAYDGTATILQPTVHPLYGGLSPHELLSAMNGEPGLSAYAAVRRHWSLDDDTWRNALRTGLVPDTATHAEATSPSDDPAALVARLADSVTGLELVFRADASVYDGRDANNAWLQEMPHPVTRITWDNAFQLSPATALELGVESEDIIEVTRAGQHVQGPVCIVPGHADRSISVALGYGRRRAGNVGNGVGFDVYALWGTEPVWVASDIQVRRVDAPRHALAITQRHDSQEGRELLRLATLTRYLEDPQRAQRADDTPRQSLYPPVDDASTPYKWGMAIDLNACIGCSACVIACQAENNIPTVGRDEVLRGRAMHWIRIDRYIEEARVAFQPVPCMHCEDAPCELVCPVGATVHSDEGLNEMIYNRCVGTRYCSNNCPYKVRRFNWFEYAKDSPALELMHNPEVSLRPRGVMEKCTYCVQRIEECRIHAINEDRQVLDGEIVTACQQVCPTQAITFGNLADAESQVSKKRQSALHYVMLGELNTRPRTTYLARIVNPPETGA